MDLNDHQGGRRQSAKALLGLHQANLYGLNEKELGRFERRQNPLPESGVGCFSDFRPPIAARILRLMEVTEAGLK